MTKTRVVILVSILVILLVFLVISIRVRRHHPFIAIYPTAVPGHDPINNTQQFLSDLNLVKNLGFEGVRLHQDDCKHYGCARVADDLNDRDLKFVMVLHSWDNSQFPQNETYVNQLIEIFTNVAEQLKNKGNLLWYALDYPYDWTRPSTQLDDPNYRLQLQRIINATWETDSYHPIYLISGMIETQTVPPTDFGHIKGFGVMPYSQKINDIEEDKIADWLEIYRKTGKNVYIAEWGVRTKEGSGLNAPYGYGWASNETMKVEMIERFIDHIYDWDIYWDYFGLHDFPLENSDWGIAYNNNTLKDSGKTIQRLLNENEKVWRFDPQTIGVIVIVIVIGAFAFKMMYDLERDRKRS